VNPYDAVLNPDASTIPMNIMIAGTLHESPDAAINGGLCEGIVTSFLFDPHV
jgi:hypothetical protein